MVIAKDVHHLELHIDDACRLKMKAMTTMLIRGEEANMERERELES